MPQVTAVCRVHRLMPDAGTVGITAIDKRPVEEPVRVRSLGLYSDIQADRENHGGVDQAVYAYADEDASWWAAELGRDVPPGLFGENLRTTGLPTSDAVVGEQWTIGADGLVLEATMPRTPCATFARRIGEKRWVRRFAEVAATGAYLRVVSNGLVRAGDRIEVSRRPSHGVTIREVFTGPTADQAHALLDAHASGEVVLSDKVSMIAHRVLNRLGA
ncbi:MOSC domain-containing protein [Phytoactinopolyspora mesophila]|uniref:MOSC domain-containing protein n=1 Tax=Phytoactinopolyspora mesophila TaxID=2650750 RepID=A0A7K3MCL0_9ACTN|nr:MOSC domain-containing protein [Phytoactinopolyspora mesophila]NDL60128.1 MOSC domain-containing protein [Phytoactinopolyspora mesophila]